jgi:hypothetical protein
MTYPQNEPDLETPEVDAAEQAALADPAWADEEAPEQHDPAPIEAPEWDVHEQHRAVGIDDEYR